MRGKRAFPEVTRMVSGKPEVVPLDTVWPAIARVVRLARLVTAPATDLATREARIRFLEDRLNDLEGLTLDGE
jgi:hypothetical protein